MPRLLFHHLAASQSAPYRGALVHLVSMQRSLFAELVRQAQRAGELIPEIDPARAAELLVAALQGVLLQWELFGRESSLADAADPLIDFWLAGLRGGEPRVRPEQAGQGAGPVEDAQALPFIAALDVRPLLEQGRDPLDAILATLERLPEQGILLLTAPFRPKPLLALLGGRGYRLAAREEAPDTWRVEVQPAGSPEIADWRELEAPEPMERVLAATASFTPGDALLARVPRHPRPLLPRLKERGLVWEVHEESDGSALLHVRCPE
jgi:uncharacterized protein (DUF2249 family)